MLVRHYSYHNFKVDKDKPQDLSKYENYEILTFSNPDSIKDFLKRKQNKSGGGMEVTNTFLSDCTVVHEREYFGFMGYLLVVLVWRDKYNVVPNMETIRAYSQKMFEDIMYYKEQNKTNEIFCFINNIGNLVFTLNDVRYYTIHENMIISKKKLNNFIS